MANDIRLDFSKVPFVGRLNELEILRQAIDDVLQAHELAETELDNLPPHSILAAVDSLQSEMESSDQPKSQTGGPEQANESALHSVFGRSRKKQRVLDLIDEDEDSVELVMPPEVLERYRCPCLLSPDSPFKHEEGLGPPPLLRESYTTAFSGAEAVAQTRNTRQLTSSFYPEVSSAPNDLLDVPLMFATKVPRPPLQQSHARGSFSRLGDLMEGGSENEDSETFDWRFRPTSSIFLLDDSSTSYHFGGSMAFSDSWAHPSSPLVPEKRAIQCSSVDPQARQHENDEGERLALWRQISDPTASSWTSSTTILMNDVYEVTSTSKAAASTGSLQPSLSPESLVSLRTVIINIEGLSGCGKTSLLDTFISQFASDKVLVARSRFEEPGNVSTSSWSAIGHALNSLLVQVLERGGSARPKSDNSERDDSFLSDFEEINGMATLLPVIAPRKKDGRQATHSVIESSVDAIRVGLTRLIREICSRYPVLLVFDDLHFASKGCLDLIASLISFDHLKQLIIIATHQPLLASDCLLSWNMQVEFAHVIDIDLGPLQRHEISSIVECILRRDADDVVPLVDLVLRKTGGNVAFVLEFLRLLEKQSLIYYDMLRCRWDWDLDKIQADTDISDNIVGLIASKFQALPSNERDILVLAACIGSATFDVDVLHKVQLTQQLSIDGIYSILLTAAEDGIVEEIGQGSFKFAHDHIRNVAYGLLPESDREETHTAIGRSAMRCLAEMEFQCQSSPVQTKLWDKLILLAASQIKEGQYTVSSASERVDFARVVYRAAQLEMDKASFAPGTAFLESALKLLRDDLWTNHFQLASNICTDLARMHYCCGLQAKCQELSTRLLKLGLSPIDHVKVSITLTRSLVQTGRGDKALQIVLGELSFLGAGVPQRNLSYHVHFTRKRIKKLLRGKPDDELLSLRDAVLDENDAAICQLLSLLCSLSALLGETKLGVLGNLQGLIMTLDKGLLPLTPTSLAAWGVYYAKDGDFVQAERYGELALKLMKGQPTERQDTLALTYVHGYTHIWLKDCRKSLNPLFEVYSRAVKSGKVEELCCSIWYIAVYFCSGLSLGPLAEEMRVLMETFGSLGLHVFSDMFAPIELMVLNLIGDEGGTERLGEEPCQFVSKKEFAGLVAKAGGCKWLLKWIYVAQLILGVYFDDMTLAADAASSLSAGVLDGLDEASVWGPVLTFYQGMAAFTGSRSLEFRRRGNKFVAVLESWAQKKAINCNHMLMILRAEQAASFGDTDVKRKFDEAIATAGRQGFLQHHALANERAGVYFAEAGDMADAEEYLTKACILYGEWGSAAKVQFLKQKYKFLHIAEANRQQGQFSLAKTRIARMSFRLAARTNATHDGTTDRLKRETSAATAATHLIDELSCD